MSFDRDSVEHSTFSKDPWCQIPQERRGTAMLRRFLSNLLWRRIREAFPGMLHAVTELLVAAERNLAAMGNPRPTRSLQRAYLVAIAQRFQTLSKQALNSPQELPSDAMKLRGMAQMAQNNFANDLRRNGQFYNFANIDETDPEPLAESAVPRLGINIAEMDSRGSRATVTLQDEIRAQIIANRGEELPGMVNPVVLKPLMQKQASKWPILAKDHLENLAHITEDAVLEIMGHIKDEMRIPDYTRIRLETIVHEFAAAARKRAFEELAKIWYRESTFPLSTNNPEFIANVKNAQLLRFGAAINRYMKSFPPAPFIASLTGEQDPSLLKEISPIFKDWAIITPDTLDMLFGEMHLRNSNNTEDEIHDLLRAYYEVYQTPFLFILLSILPDLRCF